MNATVNQNGCISCGFCIDICPEVFQFNSDGKSMVVVDEIPEKNIEQAVDAKEGCPVNVINIK